MRAIPDKEGERMTVKRKYFKKIVEWRIDHSYINSAKLYLKWASLYTAFVAGAASHIYATFLTFTFWGGLAIGFSLMALTLIMPRKVVYYEEYYKNINPLKISKAKV